MKITKNTFNVKILFITIIILLFFNIFTDNLYSYNLIESYNKFVSDYESFYKFVSTIYSIIETLINIVGFRFIIFIFFLTLVSSFLTTIGIPKGKFNFLLSIILIDVLWFIWNQSFNYTFVNNILIISKFNFIIFIPYIIVLVIKNNKMVLNKLMKTLCYSIFPFKRNKIKNLNEFKKEVLLLNEYYTRLMNNLLNDVAFNDKVKISLETKKMINELENVLKKIKDV